MISPGSLDWIGALPSRGNQPEACSLVIGNHRGAVDSELSLNLPIRCAVHNHSVKLFSCLMLAKLATNLYHGSK